MSWLKIQAENAEYQVIQSLKLNRVKRNKSREVFIEGIECIKQAIRSHIEVTRIIIKDFNQLSDWGKNTVEQYNDVTIIEMSSALFNELSDKINPSEMLMTAKIRRYSFDDIQAAHPFLIVFDRPGDYGNCGSIIRSANAFNVDGICIAGHGIDIYDPKTIRASLGGIFFTKIITIESMAVLLEYIQSRKKADNIEIIGTDSSGTVPVQDYKLQRPVMVIIGNEAKGMSIKLREICDTVIKIPMEGNVNSLNVSCAASIIMWEIYKNGISGQ